MINKKTPKKIGIVFTILLFSLCIKTTIAQGPNAPEAASFEPVDATDMVNLVTGDLSYVLPLLNVPSPEGGYPIALSYHAGIAMEQEASWVGLGWSLNPGAINRSVNGYPDDWKNGLTENIIYDSGGTVTDIGTTLDIGPIGSSIALSMSYNSNKGFGGSVGFDLGTLQYDSNKGLGVSVTGAFTKNLGVRVTKWAKSNENSVGLTFMNNSMLQGKNSIGVSISSNSISVGANSNGTGFGVAAPLGGNKNNNNYTVRTSFIGSLSVRLPLWGLSLSYRKAEYSLYDNRDYDVNGVCYPFNSSDLVLNDESHDPYLKFGKLFDAKDNMPSYDSYYVSAQGLSGLFSPKYIKSTPVIQESEFGKRTSSFGSTTYLTRNMKDDIINQNDLGEVSMDNNNLHFYFDSEHSSFLEIQDASQYFNMNLPTNQPITSIEDLKSLLNSTTIINGQSFDGYNNIDNRKKDANYIEQFKVSDILNGNATANGFLHSKSPNSETSNSAVIFQNIDGNAIGGFRITSADGKIYHYSLPVYQQEEFVREFTNKIDVNGNITEINEENAFLENRKFSPYATHWLLTAITGPDYVKTDTNRLFPDKEDFGYWVRFDYGKWSDGFGWETTIKERRYINEDNYAYHNGYRGSIGSGDGGTRTSSNLNSEINVKTYGVKQVYYLNQIKTRTHTALFVKRESHGNKGKVISKGISVQNPLVHTDVKKTLNVDNQNVSVSDAVYETFINVPAQKSLALDKIILIKNVNSSSSPNTYNSQGNNGRMWFRESYDTYNVLGQHTGNTTDVVHDRTWGTEYYGNILDINDINNNLINNAYKIISFNYNESNNTNYKDNMSLTAVSLNGKNGISTTPPYKFLYNTKLFNENDKEFHWGFNEVSPEAWSLKEIQTPVGGKIKIDYESDSYFPLLNRCENGRRGGCYDTSVTPPDRELFIGGGLRVKSISLYEGNTLSSKELYNYNLPNTNTTSGVSIYTPRDSPLNSNFLPAPQVYYKNVEVLSQGISSNQQILKTNYIFNVFNLETTTYWGYPSTIDGFFLLVGDVNNSFQDLGDLTRDGLRSSTSNIDYEIRLKNRNIIDNFSALGNLISKKTFNSENHLIEKVENTFKSNQDIKQGIVKEGYYYYQKHSEIEYAIQNDPILGFIPHWESNIHSTDYYYEIGSTYVTNYPSVLKNTITTQGGFSSTTYFDKYDFNTGQVLETTTTDSKGNEFKTELIPAYTKSEYNPSGGYGMGSKVDDITNKNMLTQEAMTKTYLKVGSNWKETGVGITTWNNQWDYTNYNNSKTLNSAIPANQKVWRKHKSFIWDGAVNATTGIYENFTGDDDSFNWTVGPNVAQTNSKWKNTSTTTQYDHYSMPLEVKDINDNYASTKTCDAESKVLAVSNAAYTDMYFSSAEYLTSNTAYYDGQVKANDKNTSEFHTGTSSEKIDANEHGFEVNLPTNGNRTGNKSRFKISVWIKKIAHTNARIHINGSTKLFNGEEIFAGNWVQKTHYEDLSTGAETVYITSASGTIYADDFKLHPATSSMTGYVYNEWDELWYIIGNNGLASKFEYDSAGRLKTTYTEVIDDTSVTGGFKKISENNYYYKVQ